MCFSLVVCYGTAKVHSKHNEFVRGNIWWEAECYYTSRNSETSLLRYWRRQQRCLFLPLLLNLNQKLTCPFHMFCSTFGSESPVLWILWRVVLPLQLAFAGLEVLINVFLTCKFLLSGPFLVHHEIVESCVHAVPDCELVLCSKNL